VKLVPDWAEERRRMVDTQLRRRGIRDERVLAAMSQIAREDFVPPEARFSAYGDEPVQIGYGQTISQPYMTALMAQELALRGDESVLEVGSGCGYAAAVLGALAGFVTTVEIIPGLAALAANNLARTGRDHNIRVIAADGAVGAWGGAPYDAISVAAGAPEIPASLLEQLNDPGILVIPVGDFKDQELRVVRKQGGRIEQSVATLCRFVPLRGGEGWR
jgi:protein-L-isoaspartate(D-aspartate) O-methyltransferase